VALVTHQGFPAELEQHALVGHPFAHPHRSGAQ
jgi:hypothetical protein